MDGKSIFDIIFNIGVYLETFVRSYGILCYVIICIIIFCETGLVVTPFLPGDSLLFAIGALAARGVMPLELSIIIIGLAAVAGDSANYVIGKYLGKKLFSKEKSFFFNKKHLIKTENFYEKHGRKTIIIARFIPVIRTFAPFVAGIGKMKYNRFFTYNVVGGFGWVLVFCLGGFFFGNIPFIKDHFSLVLAIIIVISVMPAVVAVLKSVFSKKKKPGEA
jgi:membrane-associated protein